MPDGNRIDVASVPAITGFTLENLLTPAGKPADCRDWDESFSLQPRGDSVILQGGYPVECGEREQNLAVLPHTRYVEAVFRAIWQELGGTLHGIQREGQVPASARLLSTHRSEALSSLIRDINKYSNNVMARQLFLALGESLPLEAESGDMPAVFSGNERTRRMSIERSLFALHNWLARERLEFPELVLENGAGLSRKERISARHMARLLEHAAHHPLFAELRASLPLLGVDGSIQRRLADSPAAGHAHLKTGTLEDVKTLAGYVRSKQGRDWIFVFFINHPNAKRGQDAQDALVEWLATRH